MALKMNSKYVRGIHNVSMSKAHAILYHKKTFVWCIISMLNIKIMRIMFILLIVPRLPVQIVLNFNQNFG